VSGCSVGASDLAATPIDANVGAAPRSPPSTATCLADRLNGLWLIHRRREIHGGVTRNVT
jgi:hypothetical protein